DAALRAIYRRSAGVPRVINLLCDRALLAGYADGKAQIGRQLVARAAKELRPARPWPKLRRERVAIGLGAAGVLLALGLLAVIGTRGFAGARDAEPPPAVSAHPDPTAVHPPIP